MKVYVLMQYTDYVGFGLTEDIAAEEEPYDPSIVSLFEFASSDSEDTARKLLDYFTHLLLPTPRKPMSDFGITEDDKFALSAAVYERFGVNINETP